MTEEEWDQNTIKSEVISRLAGQMGSWEQASAIIADATWEKVVRKHHELFPERYK